MPVLRVASGGLALLGKIDGSESRAKNVRSGSRLYRFRGEDLPVAPRSGNALEQPDHVTGDMAQPPAGLDVARRLGRHRLDQGCIVELACRLAVDRAVDAGKD